MTDSGYLLSNTKPQTGARFSGLEAAFDDVTVGHLERLGIGPGQCCLEVGAGGGSISRWLAARVGPSGRVVATDLDPQWIGGDTTPPLEVLRHDLLADPIPAGPWDLIHERLVLQHVPEAFDVLDRLVAALAPGGWLLMEDFDIAEVRTTDPDGPHHALIVKVARAFNALIRQRGATTGFAAGALRALTARGLVETGARGDVAIGSAGSPFALVMTANAYQVRDGLLAGGITADEFERYLAALADPGTIVGSPVLVSTWGRRAG
jgi:SAM-dependent methyltransferase